MKKKINSKKQLRRENSPNNVQIVAICCEKISLKDTFRRNVNEVEKPETKQKGKVVFQTSPQPRIRLTRFVCLG